MLPIRRLGRYVCRLLRIALWRIGRLLRSSRRRPARRPSGGTHATGSVLARSPVPVRRACHRNQGTHHGRSGRSMMGAVPSRPDCPQSRFLKPALWTHDGSVALRTWSRRDYRSCSHRSRAGRPAGGYAISVGVPPHGFPCRGGHRRLEDRLCGSHRPGGRSRSRPSVTTAAALPRPGGSRCSACARRIWRRCRRRPDRGEHGRSRASSSCLHRARRLRRPVVAGGDSRARGAVRPGHEPDRRGGGVPGAHCSPDQERPRGPLPPPVARQTPPRRGADSRRHARRADGSRCRSATS